MAVTKRAAPPTGSRGDSSMLYTSLLWGSVNGLDRIDRGDGAAAGMVGSLLVNNLDPRLGSRGHLVEGQR